MWPIEECIGRLPDVFSHCVVLFVLSNAGSVGSRTNEVDTCTVTDRTSIGNPLHHKGTPYTLHRHPALWTDPDLPMTVHETEGHHGR